MTDNSPQELECGKPKKLKNTATSRGTGNTPQAARTNALKTADEDATHDALYEAAKYECPSECPAMRLDLELSKPVVTDITVDPQDELHTAIATCDWSCTISCRDHKLEATDKPGQGQELYCTDGAVIVARGTATGKGKGAVLGIPPPPDAVAKAEAAALADAVAKLILELSISVKLAVADVRCPDGCPNKKIQIWLGPVGKPQTTAPDANDEVHCTITRRYQVRVECVK